MIYMHAGLSWVFHHFPSLMFAVWQVIWIADADPDTTGDGEGTETHGAQPQTSDLDD